jgi:hypothetical protein
MAKYFNPDEAEVMNQVRHTNKLFISKNALFRFVVYLMYLVYI